MSASTDTTRRRVKLYQLRTDSEWDDQGTGHVHSQHSNDLLLEVRSEAGGNGLRSLGLPLLLHIALFSLVRSLYSACVTLSILLCLFVSCSHALAFSLFLGRVMLESNVSRSSGYERQGENLILWEEPDGKYLALSFQEEEGCTEIWHQICEVCHTLLAVLYCPVCLICLAESRKRSNPPPSPE